MSTRVPSAREGGSAPGGEPLAPDAPLARPTIKDVALRAGVGWKTVSRALNGEPGVSASTTDQVLAAARALGYRRHRGASDLRRSDQRTATVGVLLQDLSNPFSAHVLRAVERAGREHGLSVIAASVEGDEQRQRGQVEEMVARRIDGLVIAPLAAAQDHLEREMAAGLHAVLVDLCPPGSSADAVTVDNVAGARLAVEQMLRHGHRRIAYLGDDPRLTTAQLRQQGYLEALTAAGVPPDPALQRSAAPRGEEPGWAQAALAAMLAAPDPPTAVFAAQNVLTMEAVRALSAAWALGRVALVGFDDFPLADLLVPGVSVVAQDVHEVGTRAAACLFERIAGLTAPPRRIVVPTRLVRRGSGEIPPPLRFHR